MHGARCPGPQHAVLCFRSLELCEGHGHLKHQGRCRHSRPLRMLGGLFPGAPSGELALLLGEGPRVASVGQSVSVTPGAGALSCWGSGGSLKVTGAAHAPTPAPRTALRPQEPRPLAERGMLGPLSAAVPGAASCDTRAGVRCGAGPTWQASRLPAAVTHGSSSCRRSPTSARTAARPSARSGAWTSTGGRTPGRSPSSAT